MSQIDIADAVHHAPSGENWVIARVDGDYVYPAGWPCERARLADCSLIKKATDQQRANMIEQLKKIPASDPRHIAAEPVKAAKGSATRSPEDEAEQFIQAVIDRAPEPLRRLGEYLTRVLDEDEWKTAEPMLLGVAEQRGEAVAWHTCDESSECTACDAATAPPAPAVPPDDRTEYCWSRDEEGPFHGPHDSVEEAALEALTGTDYDGVYVGERQDVDLADLIDEDGLIETMACRAGDEAGEVADGWLDSIKQADRDALKAAILPIVKAWVDAREPISFWRVTNVRYIRRDEVAEAEQFNDDAQKVNHG